MTALTVHRLRGAGIIAVALAAAAAIALALAALAVPAHAGSPDLAHADPGPSQLVVIQEADTAATARRIGWPVGVLAIVTVAALALGTAGQRRGRGCLGRLAHGTAATTTGAGAAIGSAVLDALLAGGSPAAVGVAITATILAFWRARRPEPGVPSEIDDARTRRHQRGSAAGPLLAILACAAIVAGAMGAWSCTGAQRRELAAQVVDCTARTIAAHADAWRPLVGAAIRHGDWTAVRAAAMTAAREDVGCAAAAVVIEIERPPGAVGVAVQALTGAEGPAPDPPAARAAWERLRAEQLGGRRYETRAGVL